MAGRDNHHAHEHHGESFAEKVRTIIDPVCGMRVDPETSEHHLELGGATYRFCSPRCREKFEADPDRYLNPHAHDAAVQHPDVGALADAAEGTIWTCPMHPQIRWDHPGNCPICGMALEPLEPTAEEQANPELIDMTRRFWVSTALALPVVLLVVAAELFRVELLPMRASMWVQLALTTPVVLWGGWPFFERLWASLKTRNLNMFTLIGLGVGVAYGYSVVGTLAPQLFPESLRTMGGYAPVYFEAADRKSTRLNSSHMSIS